MMLAIGMLLALAGVDAPDVRAVLPGAAQPTATQPVMSADSGFGPAVDRAFNHVVKIYGASIATEEGYCSGVIASPEGHVVTVLSLLLQGQNLRVVMPDGHVYPATVVYQDEYRQLALLKMGRFPENLDTTASLRQQMSPVKPQPLPFADPATVRSGDWVLALGNPFKVAEGEEQVSVMKGVVSGRVMLDAVRGTQPFPYRGQVLLVDAITSTPGSPGGALVDLEGRWVGLVGKTVTSRLTNTSLNYAYPVEEIQAFLADAQAAADTATRPAVTASAEPGFHGIRLSNIGYLRQLPFVKSVAPGSPAAEAGVKADDLIVSANGVAIPRARTFTELCQRLRAGDSLSLVIKRGEQLLTLRMTLTEAPR